MDLVWVFGGLLYEYGGYKGFFVDCIYIYSVIGWLCRWVK